MKTMQWTRLPAGWKGGLALAALLAWLTFLDPAYAQATGTTAPAGATSKSLLDYFWAGGIWMYPILACSLAAVGFGAYAAIMVRKARIMPPPLVARLNQMLAERKVTETFRFCQSDPSPLAAVVGAALVKANFNAEMFNKSAMEAAAAEALYTEETKLGVWVNYLNVCAQIAPMLGLLGTVVGMIEAFDQLAAGKAEPSDLASGIGVAMLTTAGGLIVAIPAMSAYFWFRGNLTRIFTDMTRTVSNMLDLFTGEINLLGQRAPTGYTQEVSPAAALAESEAAPLPQS